MKTIEGIYLTLKELSITLFSNCNRRRLCDSKIVDNITRNTGGSQRLPCGMLDIKTATSFQNERSRKLEIPYSLC